MSVENPAFPTEWRVAELRDFALSIQPGFARQPNDSAAGILQLRMPNVSRSGYIDLSDQKFVDASTRERTKYAVQPGDVIFNNTNSPELVGNAAVFEDDTPCLLSNHMTRIRVDDRTVAPAFLAAVLHRFWQTGQTQRRAKQWINQAAIDIGNLASFQIPLPPLSEQKRIVEILQEAEEIRRLRAEAEAKGRALTGSIFRAYFGEVGTNVKQWREVPVSHFVGSFQGGKSLAGVDSDFDPATPRVLKISAVTSGTLNARESKALPLSYEPPAEHFVRPGDLLITRANTAELVGATALVGDDCPENLVLPDKIWRFVWKDDFQGTPEFVWALFQEPATRRALSNIATGTGGSMKNIAMSKLMQLRVIWPPLEAQEAFTHALRSVRSLDSDPMGSRLAENLQASLSAHAFSGQLTAAWRASRSDGLSQEARQRDTSLQRSVQVVELEPARVSVRLGDVSVFSIAPVTDLNREQQDLQARIQLFCRRTDAPRYFTAESLSHTLDGPLRRNPQAIEGHLAVLAARGLVVPLSLEEQNEASGAFEFGNAYRLPRPEHDAAQDAAGDAEPEQPADDARTHELERLAVLLEQDRDGS